jgi:outer membrane biosynthesis protein TonB
LLEAAVCHKNPDMEIRLAGAPAEDRQAAPAPRRFRDRIPGGLIISTLFHLLALLLLVYGLPGLLRAPPPDVQIMPINLVQLGEETTSPSAPVPAPLPQEQAREVARPRPAQAVPVPETPPPPQAIRRQTEKMPAPEAPALKNPGRKPDISTKPVKTPRHESRTAGQPQPAPSPADDLAARLKRLAQLRQPAPPVPPDPRQQEGAGVSNLTAAGRDAARGRTAIYGVRDFIRAQVERRWHPNLTAVTGGDWVVAIHLMLSADGRVRQAEIVDDPRLRSDRTYRDFAFSARNAVLLSSPLTVPPGAYDIAKDMIIEFNARQLLR